MDNARFQVQVSDKLESAGQKGIDHTEFYFSANVGEEVKPLARVASGGEASRLMFVLKTVANGSQFPRTIVFDEIDTGIGGRVSEAVGIKLKKLSQTNQVLCVTHQPQIARFADSHLVVQKEALKGRTQVSVGQLDKAGRVEELARMLTGAEITDSARRHAKELLKNRLRSAQCESVWRSLGCLTSLQLTNCIPRSHSFIPMSTEPNKVIYSMVGVSKFYDKKPVLKDIYLSYFYGAKIGVIGLNGSGKSSLLRILAGVDKDFNGETVISPGFTVGYLEQEPLIDDSRTVREVVEEAVQETDESAERV